MTNQQMYEVEGQYVPDLKAVAAVLNVPKVLKRDIQEGGALEGKVKLVNTEEVGDGIKAETEDEQWDNFKAKTDEAIAKEVEEEVGTVEEEDDEPQPINYVRTEDIVNTKEEILEAIPEFKALKEFKDWYKDIDTQTVEYFAKALGLTWTETEHANIHRMRISMAMQRFFFPEMFKPKEGKKKKAKYGDLSTEDLFKMVAANKLDVKKTNNNPIDRMNAIMALKKAGKLPK
ncbi:hypothetical protein SHANETTE_145 [Bacillus phage Shanette]|uniref:Transcription regulation n=2 Tax=Siminovitchvirus TaxID=1918721 RepID=S5M4L6_9CAUD|nr:transcriptional regulator [Bacillus phage JL]YP_009216140.1 transcriptional regulator [Bacillus phage Shanette]AGR46816.1 transcription regulation [Bacillus phage JL]AGR47039.1 hypothetical protein SHANETTE_145 [Bacillus phage Shanette]